ncbi:Uncharacterized protein TCM_027474 [Theobroma cacao]|uniref:DNAse I-like superfamily protein n=1 Tax=Theobroma cacao TaxID=3641 RepID=A0A061G945_THECC|nr:Uncharacterized protein TCM_027474 [Theobroma cacao]
MSSHDIPRVLGGDFNVVRSQDEKLGGPINEIASSQFVEFIEELGLVDLPMSGGAFTLCNNREAATFCHLHGFLVAFKVLDSMKQLQQECLLKFISDHNAIAFITDVTE